MMMVFHVDLVLESCTNQCNEQALEYTDVNDRTMPKVMPPLTWGLILEKCGF